MISFSYSFWEPVNGPTARPSIFPVYIFRVLSPLPLLTISTLMKHF